MKFIEAILSLTFLFLFYASSYSVANNDTVSQLKNSELEQPISFNVQENSEHGYLQPRLEYQARSQGANFALNFFLVALFISILLFFVFRYKSNKRLDYNCEESSTNS